MGLDIGPKAVQDFSKAIAKAKTIIWNGPMGVFEFDAFNKGTFAMAKAIAEATQNGAYSLVGGGDSANAVNQSGLAASISHISTGGGAMLELLEGKTLAGIKALED
jgi:phosphoglycerate kinase